MKKVKKCTVCLKEKELTEFRKDKRLISGRGSQCKQCGAEKARLWNIRNRERHKENQRRWIEENKEYNSHRKIKWAKENEERKKQADRRYYYKNAEKIAKTTKIYREKNKERIKERYNIYRKENSAKINALNAKRHAAKMKRTPKWLTKEDKDLIESIYREAHAKTKQEGIHYHVDHIYPLQGKTVSGLHVPSNLQILSAKENISKNNRYDPMSDFHSNLPVETDE